MPGDHCQSLVGAGQRQQFVEVPPARHAPGQVLGHQAGLDPPDQAPEPGQMLAIEGLGTAQRQPDPMQADRIAFADLVEQMQGLAAVEEVVFAVHLDPPDRRPLAQDLPKVAGAKADARADGGAGPIGTWDTSVHELCCIRSGEWPQLGPARSRNDHEWIIEASSRRAQRVGGICQGRSRDRAGG